MIGNLSEKLFAEILQDIHSKSRSGDLAIQRGATSKMLQFAHGKCTDAQSGDPNEAFGELLLGMGKLSVDQLEAASKSASSPSALPEVLLQMKFLEREELLELRTVSIQEISSSLFNWTSGSYEFKASSTPSDSSGLQLALPTLIFEGIRRLTNLEVIHKGLQGKDRVVRLAPGFEAKAAEVMLTPDEAFILSRIESSAQIAEILQLSPLGLEMTQKSLYAFLSVGIIEFVNESRDKKAATPAATRAYRSSSAPVFQPVEVHDEEEPEEDLESVRSDVFPMLDRAKSQSYYDLLNISPTALPDEIKKSYYSLAKKYHPDRYHQSTVADLKSALETIFSTLAQAYDTLKVPATRASYDAKIFRLDPSQAGAATDKPAQATATTTAPTANYKLADLNYRQGRGQYDQQDYWSAIQAFRQSVRLEPENARYRYWLGMSLSKNTKWRREAEEHFLKAIQLEQFTADHYVGLGLLYKEAGMMKRAENQFKQALQVAPDHKVAREAIEALTGGQKKERGGLGTLKGFFKRK